MFQLHQARACDGKPQNLVLQAVIVAYARKLASDQMIENDKNLNKVKRLSKQVQLVHNNKNLDINLLNKLKK